MFIPTDASGSHVNSYFVRSELNERCFRNEDLAARSDE